MHAEAHRSRPRVPRVVAGLTVLAAIASPAAADEPAAGIPVLVEALTDAADGSDLSPGLREHLRAHPVRVDGRLLVPARDAAKGGAPEYVVRGTVHRSLVAEAGVDGPNRWLVEEAPGYVQFPMAVLTFATWGATVPLLESFDREVHRYRWEDTVELDVERRDRATERERVDSAGELELDMDDPGVRERADDALWARCAEALAARVERDRRSGLPLASASSAASSPADRESR